MTLLSDKKNGKEGTWVTNQLLNASGVEEL
jgi:hypothetical protein